VQLPVVLYTPPRISAISEQLTLRIEATRGLRGPALGAGAARRERTALRDVALRWPACSRWATLRD